jgi:hypothetical protein
MSQRSTTPKKMPVSQVAPSTPVNQRIKELDAPPKLNRKLRIEPIPFGGNFDDELFANARRRINLFDAGRFADNQ